MVRRAPTKVKATLGSRHPLVGLTDAIADIWHRHHSNICSLAHRPSTSICLHNHLPRHLIWSNHHSPGLLGYSVHYFLAFYHRCEWFGSSALVKIFWYRSFRFATCRRLQLFHVMLYCFTCPTNTYTLMPLTKVWYQSEFIWNFSTYPLLMSNWLLQL